MNLLFITTHNFATNPRIVKEIRLAIQQNFRVEVICFEFNNWSYSNNQIIKEEFIGKGVQLHILSADRKQFFSWTLNTIAEKTARIICRFFKPSASILAAATSKRNRQILQAIKKVSLKPDLVVGHNPGTIYATLKAAERFKCRSGFDVEDYHAGEGNNSNNKSVVKRLTQKCFPLFDYISYAAPLIQEAVEKDMDTALQNNFIVLNYFPADEFVAPVPDIGNSKITMVWFSQNINAGRGLELILPLLTFADLELHLFGNLNQDFYKSALKKYNNIFIHEPLPQEDLHKQLALYDIGLALEPAKDINNNLAISNKILAYLQSGLFVVSTNTSAQEQLLNSLVKHGFCFDKDNVNAAEIRERILQNKYTILQEKKIRYNSFKSACWEIESKKLLNVWNA